MKAPNTTWIKWSPKPDKNGNVNKDLLPGTIVRFERSRSGGRAKGGEGVKPTVKTKHIVELVDTWKHGRDGLVFMYFKHLSPALTDQGDWDVDCTMHGNFGGKTPREVYGDTLEIQPISHWKQICRRALEIEHPED